MSYYHIIDIDEDGNPITKEYSNQIEYEIELWISIPALRRPLSGCDFGGC